jgi:hypothetical protein
MDYQYSGDTPNRNGRTYDRQDMDDTIRRWENVLGQMGGLDHPNNFPDFLGNVE